MGVKSALLLALAAFNVTTTWAIPTIEAVGSKLFTSDGNQFFMKGRTNQYLRKSNADRSRLQVLLTS